jgi:hypothetical protein
VRIVKNLPPRWFATPEQLASACRRELFATVDLNQQIIRRARAQGTPIPDLYDSGVCFTREPWAGKFEEFADIWTVLRRGWADCDDLCAYRCAQYRDRGGRWKQTGIKIYWRLPKRGQPMTIYHAQVRLPNGDIEDPSRQLPGG